MRHFNKHVLKNGEFGDLFNSPEEYENTGKAFMSGDVSDSDHIVEATITREDSFFKGDIVRYNGLTNEFGVKAANSELRTYYKPRKLG